MQANDAFLSPIKTILVNAARQYYNLFFLIFLGVMGWPLFEDIRAIFEIKFHNTFYQFLIWGLWHVPFIILWARYRELFTVMFSILVFTYLFQPAIIVDYVVILGNRFAGNRKIESYYYYRDIVNDIRKKCDYRDTSVVFLSRSLLGGEPCPTKTDIILATFKAIDTNFIYCSDPIGREEMILPASSQIKSYRATGRFTGDCDERAILQSSLLSSLGIENVLLLSESHIACGAIVSDAERMQLILLSEAYCSIQINGDTVMMLDFNGIGKPMKYDIEKIIFFKNP